MLTRPSLGQAASLGTLYDARSDTFIPLSLLKKEPPPTAISRTDIHSSDVKYSRLDTYKEKFDHLDIGPELSASFLAGLINVDGSGRYLTAKRESNLVVQSSLLYNVTTVNETLNLQAPGVEECLVLDVLNNDLATHVVVEISWGSRNIITVKQALSGADNKKDVSARLESELAFFKTVKFTGGGGFEKTKESHDFDNSFDVTIFGDVLPNDDLIPTDLAGASRFLSNVPKYMSSANNGKGKPLTYTLLPITLLSKLLKCAITRQVIFDQMSNECSESFTQVFDEIASAQQILNDYRSLLEDHREYIPQDHLRSVGNQISEARTIGTRLKSKYAITLLEVRGSKVEENALWQILDDFNNDRSVVRRVASLDFRPFKEKIHLLKGFVAKGAKYIGFNGESLDLELGATPDTDLYVFDFSDQARKNAELWKQNVSLLHQILSDKLPNTRIILRDCDAFGEQLSTPKISVFRNAQVVTDDVLEDRKFSANKCLARCVGAHLDRSGYPKPLSRIVVKIPCPGSSCLTTDPHDWICAKCDSLIEYGKIDNYIYCNCGRCDYHYWTFRCSNSKHGLDFTKFSDVRLRGLLDSLEAFEELNVLILGRTGVGKSTWINAFVNYLTFPSLDDALEADKLSFMIPFAFRTYNVNAQGEFEDVKVKVGFNEQVNNQPLSQKVSVDEHDGTSGGSATQKTTVHRVQIGNRLIRLIDTPGIGDTRGASQDKENMADILSVLRSYKNLHGILILLKPNDQKLDLMFRFCVQELLTHLHRDAARNLAFGFTNTRGTNYMPGDTFDPLRQLLDQFTDVDISLRKHNVYCFDSESFRYLAAQKQHKQSLGHLEENRSSWTYSVNESKRLLKYFQELPPHQVTSTVNLYETRHRIVRMTEPMAAIAETIKSSISVNEDEIRELSQNDLKKKDLQKMLEIQVKTLSAVRVDRPRTACAHKSCVEHCTTGIEGVDGKPTLKTVYKTLCHSPCYLSNIKVDDVGNDGLKNCWAMSGEKGIDACRVCGHPWMSHLHINYELKEGTKTINDPEVEEALARNATFREKKAAAIAAKKRFIEEVEFELQLFRDAAAQFSIFLKRNAIMPYNDATIEYLDRHLEEERGKIVVGGSRDKLERLTQYRNQYQEQVRILDEYMKKGENHLLLDQNGVELLLKQLYDLKHYGKALKEMRQVVETAQTNVYREKPYIMRANSHWTGETRKTEKSHRKKKDEWDEVNNVNNAEEKPKSRGWFRGLW